MATQCLPIIDDHIDTLVRHYLLDLTLFKESMFEGYRVHLVWLKNVGFGFPL
jgi:hypothetical protein